MCQIWKSRNEMVFKGVLTNPMEGVNLVRHQLIEFRACHNSKKQVVVLCEEGDGAIFARVWLENKSEQLHAKWAGGFRLVPLLLFLVLSSFWNWKIKRRGKGSLGQKGY